LKKVSNIITYILNTEPEQPAGAIFENHFSEATNYFQE